MSLASLESSASTRTSTTTSTIPTTSQTSAQAHHKHGGEEEGELEEDREGLHNEEEARLRPVFVVMPLNSSRIRWPQRQSALKSASLQSGHHLRLRSDHGHGMGLGRDGMSRWLHLPSRLGRKTCAEAAVKAKGRTPGIQRMPGKHKVTMASRDWPLMGLQHGIVMASTASRHENTGPKTPRVTGKGREREDHDSFTS